MVESIGKILYNTITDRRDNPEEGSYTCYLFDKGLDKILKKIGEEATEVVIEALKDDNNTSTTEEIADLLYHILVMMAEKGIAYEDVEDTLAKRHKITGNKKAERRSVQEW